MGQIVRPTRTLFGYKLDMRVSPLLGEQLSQQINDSAHKTQYPIVMEHPNILIVNRPQFNSLWDYTISMNPVSVNSLESEKHQTNDRLFKTADGFIMELEVQDMSDEIVVADLDEVLMGDEQLREEYKKQWS